MQPLETSLILLTKDRYGLIKSCLEGLLETPAARANQIILGDTGSTDPKVFSLYDDFSRRFRGQFELVSLNHYHFSKNNNFLAQKAQGQNLIFLNNDTCGIGDWLSPLTQSLKKDNVGIAGSKLLYGYNRRIQHAGVEFLKIQGLKYLGYHPYQNRHPSMPEINVDKYMPAVTGACLAIRKDLFQKVGGFDENYAEESQDVDLCLKVQKLGQRVLYNSKSTLYHFENGTRPRLSENRKDRRTFVRRWKRFIESEFFSKSFQSEPVDSLLSEARKKCVYVKLKRHRARGDVFASSCLIEKFRQKNPNTHITYQTDYPDLVDALPFIDRVLHTSEFDDYHYDRVLDLTYENGDWRKYSHTWIEEMGRKAGVRCDSYRPRFQFSSWDEQTRVFYKDKSRQKPYVVVATGAGWKEREWENNEWEALAQNIQKHGYDVFQIGGSPDYWIGSAFHALDKEIHENLAIMESAVALITVDSFPYHVGLAIGLPIFLLTCKSCKHTTWASENVVEIRNTGSNWTPLPGCRFVGCRQKFGEGLENSCDTPILRTLRHEQVWAQIAPILSQVAHV